jgi:arylsulfatase A-like enzyme
MKQEKNQPQAKTFNKGLEFLERNRKEDNWFLQIETFDPHEPFFSQDNYKEIYEHQDMDLLHFDWPPYGEVEDGEEVLEHVRKEYASLVSMCDNYLGQVMDMMDQNNMWEDTMLIINTDHGYLLGEHNSWAKSWLPPFNEIANTPLFIWDPRSAKSGERRESLVQTIDLAPTLLDLFYEYTLIPSHMKHTFSVEELKGYDTSKPFDFTKGLNLMKIKSDRGKKQAEFPTMLYDLKENPKQDKVLEDSELEEKMIKHMIRLMQDTDAPKEQYIRLGLSNYINN